MADELERLAAEESRLRDEERRLTAQNRLLKGYDAFINVVMADPYMTAEWKVETLKALFTTYPSMELYASADWQPGLPADEGER